MTRIIIRERPATSLFRFLEEPAHASAFLSGDIWLSTLNRCRAHEGDERGDPGEGVRRYTADGLTGDSNTPAIVHATQNLGMKIEGCSHVSIQGSSSTDILLDGFVICLTAENSPELRTSFGQHGIEVFDPIGFISAVTEALSESRVIEHAVLGKIHYSERSVWNMGSHSAPPGFLKPHSYAKQHEWRLLWEGTRLPIAPQSVRVPDVEKYARGIPTS